jgi:Mrp family chromosome partitioning ATPase
MEKLQKALSKARQERDGQAASPAMVKARPKVKNRSTPHDVPVLPTPPLWEELAPFEPDQRHLTANRILTLNAEAAANPFDILRTKAFLLMRQNGWTRMAITSPNQSCGKSTTACNLAVGLSRQRENRTMLFDMDLRRPNVAKLLGRKPDYGMQSLLRSDVSPEEQMLCLRGNVAISMARQPVPDSTQLLLSQQTTDKLDEIQHNFAPDIMIFDLPPMLSTDDARAFLKNVDCALIVARAEHTKMGQLDQCEREVAQQTNVLGVVLNNCRHSTQEDLGYENYG